MGGMGGTEVWYARGGGWRAVQVQRRGGVGVVWRVCVLQGGRGSAAVREVQAP